MNGCATRRVSVVTTDTNETVIMIKTEILEFVHNSPRLFKTTTTNPQKTRIFLLGYKWLFSTIFPREKIGFIISCNIGFEIRSVFIIFTLVDFDYKCTVMYFSKISTFKFLIICTCLTGHFKIQKEYIYIMNLTSPLFVVHRSLCLF